MRSAAQRARVLRHRLVTAAATLAGALLAYGLFNGRIDEEIGAATADEERGYYLTTATLTEMGPDGSPRIVLRADSIEQRLPDGSVLLYNLDVDYKTAEAGAWTVTSQRGRMPPDHGSLLLSGDVLVTGTGDARHGRDPHRQPRLRHREQRDPDDRSGHGAVRRTSPRGSRTAGRVERRDTATRIERTWPLQSITRPAAGPRCSSAARCSRARRRGRRRRTMPRRRSISKPPRPISTIATTRCCSAGSRSRRARCRSRRRKRARRASSSRIRSGTSRDRCGSRCPTASSPPTWRR